MACEDGTVSISAEFGGYVAVKGLYAMRYGRNEP